MYYHLGDLAQQKVWGKGKWQRRLFATYSKLKEAGQPTYNLDAHVPYRFRKSLFERVMSQYNYPEGIGCTINTLFLNHQLAEENAWNQLVQADTVRAGSYKALDAAALALAVRNKTFLNHNPSGLCPVVKQYLAHSFPEACRFERTA